MEFNVNDFAGVGGPGAITIEELLAQLSSLVDQRALLPDRNTAVGETTFAFFENNWAEARDGLLARTDRIRVEPLQSGPSPYEFRFEMDLPYKSKAPSGDIELVEGPIRGRVRYRPDLFTAPENEASIVVLIDRSHSLVHPNYSRSHGICCIGGIPTGPFSLDALLMHVFSILSYQNTSVTDPADLAAAAYFATDPDAMTGLEKVEPLY